MIRKIILIILILTLILVGCQKAEKSKVEPKTTITEPPAETPSDISIESDISAIDSLDEDLDLGDLENIEAELDEINW